MDGFSSHTLKLINDRGEVSYVKWHIKTNQGIKNLTDEQATRLAGIDPDYATRDLFNAIERGEYPSWSVYIQRMTEEESKTYRFNPWDVTKVWPHGDYPLIPVGQLVLNQNPTNFFAEIEQVAFSPSHMVPGIEPSLDKMLQGRLFSYPDTHRHRLGVNYTQIPVNAPCCTKVANYQRDGFMTVNGNQGSAPNYQPNSVQGTPKEAPGMSITYTPYELSLLAEDSDISTRVGRYHPTGKNPLTVPRVTDVDFVQAGNLFRLMPRDAKQRLVLNIANHLVNTKETTRTRQLAHFYRADKDYGRGVDEAITQILKTRSSAPSHF